MVSRLWNTALQELSFNNSSRQPKEEHHDLTTVSVVVDENSFNRNILVLGVRQRLWSGSGTA
jgi:hypothetical protein